VKVIRLLVSVLGLATAINILPNPSFEVWLDTLGVNMPLGWFTSEVLYPGSAIKDTLEHSGNYCLHLIGGDTVAFATSVTIVRAGYNYEFAGYALMPAVLGGSFVLQFLTRLGNPAGTPQLIPVYYSNDYRQYSRWITAPDSAFFLSVSCLSLPGAEVYFDDVTVEDTTITGIYEQVMPGFRKGSLEKFILFRRQKNNLTAAGFFDVLGRRINSNYLSAGVYFLTRW